MTLRLVIFDVDGTLVDSQGDILASMQAAFGGEGLAVPGRDAILSIVGLSLPVAMARLAPGRSEAAQGRLVQAYKDTYADLRKRNGAASSPLYPGAMAAIEALHAQPATVLGIATGKSKRGLDALIENHGLERFFITRQVADFHPSKPHPSMVLTALKEAGVGGDRAVMVGDTSYDMQMAQSAGVAGIGVTWGYHARAALSGAARIIDEFGALPAAVDAILGEMT